MLSDEQYRQWPRYRASITFAYNTAPHQSLGGISPFELYYGMTARDTFSQILTTYTDDLVQPPTDEGDMQNARLFALAVRISTTSFVQLARNHDTYVKNETADLLNDRGFPRTFVLGALVKARFPPTKAELDITGRRSNHVSSWRGPCRVIARLSSTTYRIKQLDNLREYERSIANLLAWRATAARIARNAQYDAAISTPLLVGEFLAIRDEPNSWFYIAKITYVGATSIIVHYYGTKSEDLQRAKFHPC
jgi:hypothetical protein